MSVVALGNQLTVCPARRVVGGVPRELRESRSPRARLACRHEIDEPHRERAIRAAYEKDPASAAAEWGAEFRTDVAAFLPVELIDAAVVNDRELPPVSGVSYRAFVDPSGGSSDSFTLAIAHLEKERVVLDVVREHAPPFSPEKVVDDYAQLLRAYRCFEVVGDRYGGEFPRELFTKRGVEYKLAELNRSELYLEMLPLLTAGRADLLCNARLRSQLVSLERRPSRLGRDIVDHAIGAHDDLANAVAGALVLASAQAGSELGLIEYLKGIAAGKFPDPTIDVPAKPSAAPASPMPPVVPRQLPPFIQSPCPTRNSETLVLKDAQTGMHECSSCGTYEQLSRFAPAISQTRGEYLARQGRFAPFRGTFGRFGR